MRDSNSKEEENIQKPAILKGSVGSKKVMD